MKFGIFSKYGALNSAPVFDALTTAIKRKGWQFADHDEHADVAVIWSVLWAGRMKPNQQIWNTYKKTNRPVLILEIGALNRGNLWKVAINGINASGYFGPTPNDDLRKKKLDINPMPWKKGDHIIICGQHPHSQQWQGMPPIDQWVEDTIAAVRMHTDRKIVVRPHPRANCNITKKFKNVEFKVPQRLPSTYDSYDFESALKNAWAVVNWNSNPSTVAALKGIPVFVGPDSLSAPVGNLDLANIEKPVTPDRTQWANDLAYTEWSTEEISNGHPLDRLTEKLTSLV